MDKIRFGVVGAGKIGTFHTRTLAKMKEVDLVGVADVDLLRAQPLAWNNNTIAYGDYRDLLPQIDALVVAVPTHLHAEVAMKAMSNGIHCMVEKPITDSIDDAKKLSELSEKEGVVLQVGHVERFNPAVVEAQKYVKSPLYINMERLGPYDPRVSSIGVTLDLMIHDLDILLSLVNSEIASVDSIGARVFSNHEDISNARIKFKNGVTADLTASRITFERIRRMRIYQDEEYISVDYISSKIRIYRKKNDNPKNLNDIEILAPKIEKKLPITQELYHFIDCIKNSKKPVTDANKGINALKLAIAVTDNIKRYDLPRQTLNEKSRMSQKIGDAIDAAKIIFNNKLDNKTGD
jgi:predicted dehydrogenase